MRIYSLDDAVRAGIRASAKKGHVPVALLFQTVDLPVEKEICGLPVFSLQSARWDDWDTDCECAPLFAGTPSLCAERAFMEAMTAELAKPLQ